MDLQESIDKLLNGSKGILAADESFGTIGKRFAKNKIESTPETRQQYREMLFSSKGIENYISGVILFDETIRQNSSTSVPLVKHLSDKGIVPGIKVDKGTSFLINYGEEKITSGLDGLAERLQEYRDMGARFAKWRAVFSIGTDKPSYTCINSNSEVLARYAALCQHNNMVPIVEPEVLMDGDHQIGKCEDVTTAVLQTVFSYLHHHKVILEAILLKPNMVLPGKNSPVNATSKEIAEATIRTLRRSVPASVPGIVFLSGGQTPVQATENLAAINNSGTQPWKLSFSFSRALQDLAIETWAGKKENIENAQNIFLYRAKCNSAARRGELTDRGASSI